MKQLIFKLLVLGLLAASPLMFSIGDEVKTTKSQTDIQYLTSDDHAIGGG